MEKRYSEVIGTLVVSQNDNEELGRVKHVLIDTDKGKIVAFLVRFVSDQVVLPTDIIQWDDVILVQSKDDLVTTEEIERVKEVKEKKEYLLTKKVETEGGRYVGRVYDYAFNDKLFELRKIYVRKAFLGIFFPQKYLISARSIVEISKDRVIVRDAVLKEMSFKLNEHLSPDF